ncbi:MAG: flagellar biosynthesis protein FlgH, partial [Novosphingobium sp.]|nr:flagellar biosynthesis protein FlgH [Novosphingobium sp.]
MAFISDPASAARPRPGFEATLPQAPAPVQVAPPTAGSIFNASAGYAGLVEGRRARSVGDPLTVVLTENLTSAKTAGAKTQKSGQFSVVPPTAGPLSFLNP